MIKDIHRAIDELYSEMVDIRRYLHQYPELSFHEIETATFISDFYEKLGIPYQEKFGGNGVIATLKGGKPGKTIALRADFDALPIQEENDVPYKSKIDGVMHACGHDGHTAVLLTLAKAIQPFQSELPGTIKFLHQYAEEQVPGGAKPMIEAGALNEVDAIFGTHLWATTPLGVLQTSKNAFMAGADDFEIIIQGQGGHGAQPHHTKDAIVIGSQVVSELQKIVSRRIDPLATAVITIGVFEAGDAFNIIADKARLTGTVRYLRKDVQKQVKKEMETIIKGVCIGNDATYTLNYNDGYPPLINHEKEADLVLQSANKIPEIHKAEEIIPEMAGEDFAYYMMERPGAYFFTGAQIENHEFPHHHPKFDIDERALPIAAKTLIQAYFDYQEEHK
ncbi:M20 family metallopeptidase [Virgibacillus alimentarius]|uniref:Amidohydrolase n=1 Tax=Virgibacillus alimentarius TaxID=698769 RepID=A0ABS4SCT3_9BACI|nr:MULTISPECIES: M20 family metallopeptidase [Virgibacillus]MBP2258830.1 amidohydrolase [Virgibacillus alimentarius]HLR65771.1 M20 family metallopeptidase [Virgibacillus sp.]